MKIPNVSIHRGVTILEVIIVLAIVGILTGLTLTAIQAARAASIHTQSVNNERQLILSFQQLLDTHESKVKNLPHAKDFQATFGDMSIFNALLPWTYGDRIPYSPNMTSSQILESTYPSVKIYISPGDPSINFEEGLKDAPGKISYVANMMVFDRTVMYPFKISDGTTATICFGEHYYLCGFKGSMSLDYTLFFPSSSPDPRTDTRRATFADAGWADVVPVTSSNVSKPSVPGYTFQDRPKVPEAWARVMQTPHRAGLPVAMFDGSVRTLRSSIDETVFWALVTPSGGEIVSLD